MEAFTAPEFCNHAELPSHACHQCLLLAYSRAECRAAALIASWAAPGAARTMARDEECCVWCGGCREQTCPCLSYDSSLLRGGRGSLEDFWNTLKAFFSLPWWHIRDSSVNADLFFNQILSNTLWKTLFHSLPHGQAATSPNFTTVFSFQLSILCLSLLIYLLFNCNLLAVIMRSLDILPGLEILFARYPSLLNLLFYKTREHRQWNYFQWYNWSDHYSSIQ